MAYIRVRNAGASGRECSALAGRHYLPSRQASFTSFFNKESKLQLSGRWAWIPSSLLSVCNQDNSSLGRTFGRVSPLQCIVRKPRFSTLRIISSKEDGSPYLVIADEDLTLDFEAGTPGTSNHGAGVRCFISAHEKIFWIDLWDKTRSSRVARMREPRPEELHVKFYIFILYKIWSFVKVSIKDTMTRILNFKYCPLCKTYFCDDCLRR